MTGLCHKCLTSNVEIKIYGGDIICMVCLEKVKNKKT